MSSSTGEQQRSQHELSEQATQVTPAPRSPDSGEHSSESGQGRTTVADIVVSKIAAMAARDVSGVYDFGGGTSRALGAMRERIPGARASSTQGVRVEVGERQAAIDVVLVVEYGAAIADLARGVRRHVTEAIERMTGLDVVEVNIEVTDLHLPNDDDGDGSRSAGRAE